MQSLPITTKVVMFESDPMVNSMQLRVINFVSNLYWVDSFLQNTLIFSTSKIYYHSITERGVKIPINQLN